MQRVMKSQKNLRNEKHSRRSIYPTAVCLHFPSNKRCLPKPAPQLIHPHARATAIIFKNSIYKKWKKKKANYSTITPLNVKSWGGNLKFGPKLTETVTFL